jgi:hypothetical protein
LTRHGQQTFDEVWEAGQAIRDQMVSTLNTQEKKTLVTLLQKVTGALAADSMVVSAASNRNRNGR